MSKLKGYEIEAVTDKVMELLKEEWSKNQPIFTKETKERLALEAKISKLNAELQELKDQTWKMTEDMRKKYKDVYIAFDGKKYHSQNNNWQTKLSIKQEIILSQIKSDNLDETISNLVKKFAK
jgi:uncharacterized protein YihD (DUF1040 family)